MTDKPDRFEDEHEMCLPPPGFLEPNEPEPFKGPTEASQGISRGAGGWVYTETQHSNCWSHCAENGEVYVVACHPSREVAKSAVYRAAEILERGVPV